MGTHWNAGLIRWWPHKDKSNKHYSLSHLHPFRFEIELPQKGELSATVVYLQVGFAMHCFTRAVTSADAPEELYSDERETRAFDLERYELSKQLPQIVRSLQGRPCAFAKQNNYVTIDLKAEGGKSRRYGVFFNVRRRQDVADTVQLIVQSAYPLDKDKPDPAKGRIRFNVLLGHALRGTRPRPA